MPRILATTSASGMPLHEVVGVGSCGLVEVQDVVAVYDHDTSVRRLQLGVAGTCLRIGLLRGSCSGPREPYVFYLSFL